jgi:nucleotide-binding universal stress UspA family protein
LRSAIAIKTILVAASGGTATRGTIELACQLAQRFRALSKAITCSSIRSCTRVDGRDAGLGLTGTLIESIEAVARVRAEETRSLFAKVLVRREIAMGEGPHAIEHRASGSWRQESGYAPILVANRARFFDLAVLGRSERAIGQPYTDTIEQVLTSSRRPVLLVWADAPATIGNTVAIAWNGSPEAVPALSASLPFLMSAAAVWNDHGWPQRHEPISAIGVSRLTRHQGAASQTTGQAARHVRGGLLDAAQSCRADLLVMGGYGHAFWRDMVFGGATLEIIKSASMPSLLMH